MPRVTYIIASTMRTGSYLLCEALTATGQAGRPREIFCPERREMYAGEWTLPIGVSFDAFLQKAIAEGTTENGIFGFKIHQHHVDPLAQEGGSNGKASEILRRLFPDAKYVYLRRRDRRAQAISWYRARESNEWWRIAGVEQRDLEAGPLQFHAPEIRRFELELGRQQEAWDAFFAEGKADVLTMDYETLRSDYRGEVARVLTWLGEDAKLAWALPEPRLQVQADALTEEWRTRMDQLFPL